jgi:hypothetical protein
VPQWKVPGACREEAPAGTGPTSRGTIYPEWRVGARVPPEVASRILFDSVRVPISN